MLSGRMKSGNSCKQRLALRGRIMGCPRQLMIHGVDSIMGDALEHEVRRSDWGEADADIAIAVTPGDDPWILSQSPLPSPNLFDWPKAEEVEASLNSRIDKGSVLNRLKCLASQRR